MKTAKFSEVVKRCGAPSVHLAWMDPGRDPTLKRALAEHRVMTIHQEPHGGKKDFGSVGFIKDRHAQLLVFSKSLRKFSDRKIVAINYSLMAKEPLGPKLDTLEKQERSPARAKPKLQPIRLPRSEIPAPENKARARLKTVEENNALADPGPEVLKEILAEVKRAVGDLSLGRSISAYDRLKRLLENNHR